MTGNPIENKIKDAMQQAGVEAFWIQSAINQIRMQLNTNQYFATRVKEVRVTPGRLGYAKRVSFYMNTLHPDKRKENQKIQYKVLYRFDEKKHFIMKQLIKYL